MRNEEKMLLIGIEQNSHVKTFIILQLGKRMIVSDLSYENLVWKSA